MQFAAGLRIRVPEGIGHNTVNEDILALRRIRARDSSILDINVNLLSLFDHVARSITIFRNVGKYLQVIKKYHSEDRHFLLLPHLGPIAAILFTARKKFKYIRFINRLL
jgi:hypothetical protein